MSRMADEFIANMTDAEFLIAVQRARVLNLQAEAVMRLRAEHIRNGGILCRRCSQPVPRFHEQDYRGVFDGEFRPVCSAKCMADCIAEEGQ